MPLAYCQFGFPMSGGASGGGAIVGGSGTSYDTIDDAIAGETETVYNTTTAAGTTNGTITGGAGWPSVDDELTGAFVVLTSAAPGNGKAAIWARIVDYVGASKVATLDSPVDFGVGLTVAAIFPAVITLNQDLTEDATINKSVMLNMGGTELVGKINITAGRFVWLNNGKISNGIEDSRSIVGMVRMDSLVISFREATTGYAFVKTNAVNVGAVEAINCEFRGLVVGRQGICRWLIVNCLNAGIDDGVGNIPWRLVEADKISVVASNVAVSIDSEFCGAIFYSSAAAGAITSGAPNYLSVFANIKPPLNDFQGNTVSPRSFSLLAVVGGATATVTVTAGQVSIIGASLNNGNGTDETAFALDFALLRGRNLTGSGTLTLSTTPFVSIGLSPYFSMSSLITVDGASNMTGTLTLNGTARTEVALSQNKLALVLVRSHVTTGSVTLGGAGPSIKDGRYVAGILFTVDQTSSTPAITINATTVNMQNIAEYDPFGFDSAVVSVSVGTWTISSEVNCDAQVQFFRQGLTTVVTGGAWVNSGDHSINFASGQGNIVNIATHFGAGGTLTVNGLWRLNGGQHDRIRICHSRGAGNTVTRLGDTFIRNCVLVGPTETFIQAETATSTAVCTGVIYCDFVKFATVVIVNSTAVGSAVSGPSDVHFVLCDINTDLTTETGLGTITWTGAILAGLQCNINGLFTLVGTRFSIVAFETCTFAKTVTSVSFSGSRPSSVYVYLKCTFAGIVAEATGKPDILDDYFMMANNGSAKARGQIVKFDTTPQVSDTGATDTAEGVVWLAVGSNTDTVTVVRRGFLSVLVTGTVTIGDNLIIDAGGTPTHAITGSTVVGKRIGRAFTADAASLAYTCVNLM